MATQQLEATVRTTTGRKVKNLRSQGLLPANIFGKDVKSVSISISSEDFNKVYKEAGETGIVDIAIDKKKRPVLVSNVQVHPVSGDVLHVDFRQVDLTKKISAMVPVELVGESPAEKDGLGTVVQPLDDIEVEALPTDFPEKFEVDISVLDKEDSVITVADIKHDSSKVTIIQDKEQVVVRIEQAQEEVEVPVVATEEGEAEAQADVPTESAGEKEEASEEKTQ